MTHSTIKLTERHCWGFGDESLPEIGELTEVAGFPHAKLTHCPVTLWKTGTGSHWVSYPRESWRIEDGSSGYERAGKVVREWCPVSAHDAADFGGSGTRGTTCGACGHNEWTEFHGMAAGYCNRCRYGG